MSRIYKRVFKPVNRIPAPASAYVLSYNGGPLLTTPQVSAIFLGSAWKKNPADVKYLEQFFPSILTSTLMDQMAEYNTGSHHYGHGKFLGSVAIPHLYKGKKIDDNEIQALLKSWIAAGKVPPTGAQTLYFIFTPKNIKVTAGAEASCTVFCGYHDAIDQHIYYAVIPYPSCNGCLDTLQPEQALTVTTSHELCEAMTDPNPGHGWYNNQKGESGDYCVATFKTISGYTVQQEWSNKIMGCK